VTPATIRATVHPIVGRATRRSAVSLLVVVCAFTAACSRGEPTAQETASAPPPVPVQVAPVSTVTVERVADAVGAFYANEEVTVSSQIDARIEWLGPDMGDHVRAGDVILKLDGADIRAELREVAARLAKARADDVRAQQLRQEGIMAAELAEKMRTDVTVLEAQRDVLAVKLDRTVIRSPLTGAIAERLVSVGEVVQKAHALYRIVEDNPLKFRTPIPERFAAFLRLGLTVRVRVDAYAGRTFAGTVTRINPTSEAANRSITIEAEVPNPEGLLKPGFFGVGSLVYDEHAHALAVPARALTSFAGVTKLFVIADGKAQERVVRTGVIVAGGQRQIIDGVAEGEQVAVTSVDKLEHGLPVSPIEPVAVESQTR
jgi:membrane fusion protein (multidrug efflux system)